MAIMAKIMAMKAKLCQIWQNYGKNYGNYGKIMAKIMAKRW